jgi:hypothetical protein
MMNGTTSVPSIKLLSGIEKVVGRGTDISQKDSTSGGMLLSNKDVLVWCVW